MTSNKHTPQPSAQLTANQLSIAACPATLLVVACYHHPVSASTAKDYPWKSCPSYVCPAHPASPSLLLAPVHLEWSHRGWCCCSSAAVSSSLQSCKLDKQTNKYLWCGSHKGAARLKRSNTPWKQAAHDTIITPMETLDAWFVHFCRQRIGKKPILPATATIVQGFQHSHYH